MADNSTSISLTGGLGNQLFQFAAALSLSREGKVELVTDLASPRVSLNGEAELLSFELPSLVINCQRADRSFLARKSAGYILRMGVSKRWYEKPKIIFNLLRYLASIVISFEYRQKLIINPARGIGVYDSSTPSKNILLVGYFQSYKWAAKPNTFSLLHSLKPSFEGEQLLKLKLLAKEENPLVVHIRLGDYLSEPTFGIPSLSYYETSIREMLATSNYGKIWIFSDDLQYARRYMPADLLPIIRWIDEVDNSSVATLEAMRCGKGYIIANSTFSWWGAFLSYENNPLVVAPEPWFQGMDSPTELIPPSWILRPAF
jgi:hypothetical protein